MGWARSFEGHGGRRGVVRHAGRVGHRGFVLTMAGVAQADVPTAAPEVGSYETSGCPSTTPIWVFHYDLYWTGYAGATSNEVSIQPGVLAEASKFAQDVGILSGCAVRARADVFSHSDAHSGSTSDQPQSPA
jgi:hypothetical protein